MISKLGIHQNEYWTALVAISSNGSLDDLTGASIKLVIGDCDRVFVEEHAAQILNPTETGSDGNEYNLRLVVDGTTIAAGDYTSQIHITDASTRLHVHNYHPIEIFKTSLAP